MTKKLKTITVLLVLAIFFSIIAGNCDDSKPEDDPEKNPATGSFSLRYNGAPIPSNGLELALSAGSLTFTAVDKNDKDVDFTLRSSKTTVATVSGKTVTLRTVGDTNITATDKSDSTNKQEFKLTITAGPSYSIVVVGGTADKDTATFGTTVTLTPVVPAGKSFVNWTIEPSVTMATSMTFKMPAFAVTVTANFVDWSPEGKNPYYITTNYGQDASKEFLVQWHNDVGFTTQTFQYVKSGTSFDNATSTEVTGKEFSATDTAEGKWIGDFAARKVFRMEVKNLEPDTLYDYRMGVDDVWSDTFHHKTASASYDDFSFTVVADPQAATHTNMKNTLTKADAFHLTGETADNRFFLMLGDVVNEIGKRPAEIVSYTNTANDFNKEKPIIATQGNHDTYRTTPGTDNQYVFGEATVFNNFVTFPDNGWDTNADKANRSQSYYFYYNEVLIVVLNTMATQNATGTSEPNHSAQATWLKNLLEKDKTDGLSKFRIVVTHVSPFGGRTSERWLQPGVRQAYGKIFSDFKVDIVFGGHDHVYGRSNPIEIGTNTSLATLQPQFAEGTSGGVIYSIAGATGPKFYSLDPDAMRDQYFPYRLAFADNSALGFFVNVKVTADKLIVTAVRADTDAAIDEYEVPIKN